MSARTLPNVFNIPNVAERIVSMLGPFDPTRVRLLFLADNRSAREAIEPYCARLRKARSIILDAVVTTLDDAERVRGARGKALLLHDLIAVLNEYDIHLDLLGSATIDLVQSRFRKLWSEVYPFAPEPSLFVSEEDGAINLEITFFGHLLHPHLAFLEHQ